MQKGKQLQDSHIYNILYIHIYIYIYIYICGGWVRGVLNQSTTHCYFGDRDVHAMGTCSANLNDDHRGGLRVCAFGWSKMTSGPGATKRERLRRKRLVNPSDQWHHAKKAHRPPVHMSDHHVKKAHRPPVRPTKGAVPRRLSRRREGRHPSHNAGRVELMR
jgi:hypothetical protein